MKYRIQALVDSEPLVLDKDGNMLDVSPQEAYLLIALKLAPRGRLPYSEIQTRLCNARDPSAVRQLVNKRISLWDVIEKIDIDRKMALKLDESLVSLDVQELDELSEEISSADSERRKAAVLRALNIYRGAPGRCFWDGNEWESASKKHHHKWIHDLASECWATYARALQVARDELSPDPKTTEQIEDALRLHQPVPALALAALKEADSEGPHERHSLIRPIAMIDDAAFKQLKREIAGGDYEEARASIRFALDRVRSATRQLWFLEGYTLYMERADSALSSYLGEDREQDEYWSVLSFMMRSQSGRFEAEYSEVLPLTQSSVFDPEMRAYIRLQVAWDAYRHSNLDLSERLLVEATPFFPLADYPLEYIECLVLHAKCIRARSFVRGHEYSRKRAHQKGLKLLREAYQCLQGTMNAPPRVTAQVLQDCARFLEETGDLEKAEQFLKKSLHVRLQAFGAGNLETVRSRYKLAEFLAVNAKTLEQQFNRNPKLLRKRSSEMILGEVLPYCKRAEGKGSAYTDAAVFPLLVLGQIFFEEFDWPKAERYFREALKVASYTLPSEHLNRQYVEGVVEGYLARMS